MTSLKINIEDYLQQIDASFKDKSQKDVYMIYMMLFMMIFAVAYLFFWETSEADFNNKRAQVVALEKKIADDNRFLKLNPPAKVTNLQNEIKSIQNKTIVFQDNNQYIKTKIEEISALIYDEQTWGEYLHSISKYAKLYDIKLIEFSNKLTQNNNGFGHVLDISIQSDANYKNTLNFINSLEQSDLVVDLHDFTIKNSEKTGSKLDSTLDISVWGITY